MAGGTTPNKNLPTLPDIPLNKDDWQRLRTFLREIKRRFEGTIQNPDPPDQVSGLILTLSGTTGTSGVQLTWNPSNRATAYSVFRALDSISFSDALCIGTIPRSDKAQFYDPADSAVSTATKRTYWVRSENGLNSGPLSVSVSTTAALSGGGGPPALHHTTHENGGTDEINVAGLSGLLADKQTPLDHNHTSTASDGGVLTNDEHDGFSDFIGISTPSTPVANHCRIYPKTSNGHTSFHHLDQDGTEFSVLRDSILLVRNTSGGSLSKGTVVTFIGATGQIPDVGKAAATATTTFAVGVMAETVANNGFGLIYTVGILSNFDTSAWADGAQLFLSNTAGLFSSTRGTYKQGIAVVVYSHATQGQLFIYPDTMETPHHLQHESGGVDAVKLDDLATPDDNTDLDSTTGHHGLLQKLPGGTTTFLRADGSFTAPPGAGNFVGPASSTDGDVVVFDGITGKLGKDTSKVAANLVTGPASAVDGDVVVYDGTTGKLVKDTSKVAANLVTGPASAVSGNIAVYDGTTGKLVKDGGTIPSGGVGGGLAVQPFRLTLSSGNPIYRPQQSLTPSSTDTTADTVTFAAAHGWTVGTIAVAASTSGGLSGGVLFYLHIVSSTSVSFHLTVAAAIAGTSPVNLTGNVTAAILASGVSNTTLYFSPVIGQGRAIQLFDGSSTWALLSSAEVSIALGTLTSALPYDVFAYNNSGTLTLELLAWTSDTARATALVSQDGIWVKTGATTRRYVGTIRTDSTTTTIDDGGGILSQLGARRFVWNMDNKVGFQCRVFDATGSWTHSTAGFLQANGAAGNKLEFVCGLPVNISARLSASGNSSSNSTGVLIGINVDSTTAQPFQTVGMSGSGDGGAMSVSVDQDVQIGYHSIVWCDSGNGTITATFYGNVTSQAHSGLTASLLC